MVFFSARGISGNIQFIALDENNTQILVNLQGLRGKLMTMHIHYIHWCIYAHACTIWHALVCGMHRYMAYISLVPTSFSRLHSPLPSPTKHMQSLIGLHTWHVHTLPIDQTRDPTIQCLSSWAGPHYDPFDARGSLTDAEYQMQCTSQTPLG